MAQITCSEALDELEALSLTSQYTKSQGGGNFIEIVDIITVILSHLPLADLMYFALTVSQYSLV